MRSQSETIECRSEWRKCCRMKTTLIRYPNNNYRAAPSVFPVLLAAVVVSQLIKRRCRTASGRSNLALNGGDKSDCWVRNCLLKTKVNLFGGDCVYMTMTTTSRITGGTEWQMGCWWFYLLVPSIICNWRDFCLFPIHTRIRQSLPTATFTENDWGSSLRRANFHFNFKPEMRKQIKKEHIQSP